MAIGIVAVVGAATLFFGSLDEATAGEGAAHTDERDDFLLRCEGSSKPRSGLPTMDLVEVSAASTGDGGAQAELTTRSDVGTYFASNPPSAAFVFTVRTANGKTFEAVHELHEGKPRDGVDEVQASSRRESTAKLTVSTSGPTVKMDVSGLPSLKGAKWSATTFNMPDGNTYVCDQVGVGPGGMPQFDLDLQPSSTTSSEAPAGTPTSSSSSASVLGTSTTVLTEGPPRAVTQHPRHPRRTRTTSVSETQATTGQGQRDR